MTLDEYLASTDFKVFLDETLRDEAIRAADDILSKGKPIKRHQMHAIPSVIQGAGLPGLRKLAEKQKEKNTNQENKAFWTEIEALLSATPTSELSLFRLVQSLLHDRGCLDSEETGQDKQQQRQIRKRNRVTVEHVMEGVIGVYFEHFNCHYSYSNR